MITIKSILGNEVKIFAETFEFEAYDQIKKLANYPAYASSKIRIMPDAHAGAGCTIGTTMTITDAITPNLVGVDIGCGMLTIRLKDTNINFKKLDDFIHEYVPNGFSIHNKAVSSFDFDNLLCHKEIDLSRALLSIGSLGGGNHFIEVDRSEKDNCFYLVIHSGSRNLGLQVCKYYQNMAFSNLNEMSTIRGNLISRLKKEGREKDISTEIKKLQKPKCDKDLAHLTGDGFKAYLNDMAIVQKYAVLNRQTIADIIIKGMGLQVHSKFETIHNYIDFNRMILRKGSVSAENGEKLLIPINMRDGSLLCIGKGNEDWNYSAPHGAGRLMSRSKAKEAISMCDFKSSMDGVFTTSVCPGTIDEAPQAYKSMNEIRHAITETVDVIDTIKPVYNFKAS